MDIIAATPKKSTPSGPMDATTTTPTLTPTDTLLERLHLIPDELIELDQWICWRQEVRHGKPTKVPYQAQRPNIRAETDDPTTWSTFQNAVKTFADCLDRPNRLTGIGFVFSVDDPFTGIDFDDCVTGDVILSDVLNAIEKFGGYAEISPSMTGVKLWTRATMPIPEGRTGFVQKGLFGCSKVEVYSERRYFACTGWRLDI